MYRSVCNSLVRSVNTLMTVPQEFATTVRYRYFKDKQPLARRWGYEDVLAWRGPLPRPAIKKRLPMPEYNPTNAWTEKRALFGQNDYIDILGNPKLHPVLISYDVPPWLRGFQGNEYQTLIRKRRYFGAALQRNAPVAYRKLQALIRYQHYFLNYCRPQNRMPKAFYKHNQNK